MEIMNWQEITMESETFSKIRESFNLLLQRLFQKMEQNHSDEGAITLKVNLSISKDFIPDGNGSSREVHKPILKYKIDTQVPVKDGFDGKNDTGMELVYDDELKRYVLRYVSENLLAGVVAVILSIAVDTGYMILTETLMNEKMAVILIALVLLSWLCAMVGYDKVIQAISQFKVHTSE